MEDYGIKVTKDDKKIDSLDSLDYVLHSGKQNLFTLDFNTGNYTFTDSFINTAPVSQVRVFATIPHNLGYIPTHLASFSDNGANYVYIPLRFYYFNYDPVTFYWVEGHINSYCDNANLYLSLATRRSGAPPASQYKDMTGLTFAYKYYIFTNKIGE